MLRFFSPRVIKGNPDITVQGTSFVAGRPVAGYVDDEFIRGDVNTYAREKHWLQPYSGAEVGAKVSSNPMSDQNSGMRKKP